jgi:hypothetical protein
MSSKLPRGTLEALWGDPDNWRPGGIYYCKSDPRIIVPKRNRAYGWTMNFANNLSWLALFILLTSALPAVFLKSFGDPAALAFICVWIVLLVVVCLSMSSTERHED